MLREGDLVLLSLGGKLLHARVIATGLKSRSPGALVILAHHDFHLRRRAADARRQHPQTRWVAASRWLLCQSDGTVGRAGNFEAEVFAQAADHRYIVATNAVDSNVL